MPSVFSAALGKELVCRVPERIHSTNIKTLGKIDVSGSGSLLLVGHVLSIAVAACARPDEDGHRCVNSKPWTVNYGGVDRPEPRTDARVHS